MPMGADDLDAAQLLTRIPGASDRGQHFGRPERKFRSMRQTRRLECSSSSSSSRNTAREIESPKGREFNLQVDAQNHFVVHTRITRPWKGQLAGFNCLRRMDLHAEQGPTLDWGREFISGSPFLSEKSFSCGFPPFSHHIFVARIAVCENPSISSNLQRTSCPFQTSR